jgi:hypothetical protein
MESIENFMDPRAKEKHEEEHEDSKRERNVGYVLYSLHE